MSAKTCSSSVLWLRLPGPVCPSAYMCSERKNERIIWKGKFSYRTENNSQPPAQLFSGACSRAGGASPVPLPQTDSLCCWGHGLPAATPPAQGSCQLFQEAGGSSCSGAGTVSELCLHKGNATEKPGVSFLPFTPSIRAPCSCPVWKPAPPPDGPWGGCCPSPS